MKSTILSWMAISMTQIPIASIADENTGATCYCFANDGYVSVAKSDEALTRSNRRNLDAGISTKGMERITIASEEKKLTPHAYYSSGEVVRGCYDRESFNLCNMSLALNLE